MAVTIITSFALASTIKNFSTLKQIETGVLLKMNITDIS